MRTIYVRPLSWFAKFLDLLAVPVMYLVSGTFREAPQETHFWNNTKLRSHQIAHIDRTMTVDLPGDPTAHHCSSLRAHMPILGGWRNYVVLRPTVHWGEWYVGWAADDVGGGVSRIPLYSGVRLLKGTGPAKFFGIDSEGRQVDLDQIGEGRIGAGDPYAVLPLR